MRFGKSWLQATLKVHIRKYILKLLYSSLTNYKDKSKEARLFMGNKVSKTQNANNKFFRYFIK